MDENSSEDLTKEMEEQLQSIFNNIKTNGNTKPRLDWEVYKRGLILNGFIAGEIMCLYEICIANISVAALTEDPADYTEALDVVRRSIKHHLGGVLAASRLLQEEIRLHPEITPYLESACSEAQKEEVADALPAFQEEIKATGNTIDLDRALSIVDKNCEHKTILALFLLKALPPRRKGEGK